MHLPLLILILGWLGLFALSFHSPGVGLAIAAIAGRYEFPQRGPEALIEAGPLILLAALAGVASQSGKSGRRTIATLLPAGLVWLLAIWGAVGGLLRGGIDPDGSERVFLLQLYVAPVCLLAAALTSGDLRQFRIWFVRIAAFLGAIALAVGSTDATGRAAALGGGPIPLAQLSMIALLLVLLFKDQISPVAVDRRTETTLRAGLMVLFVIVGLRTASRFPIIAVGLAALLMTAHIAVTGTNLTHLLKGRSRMVYKTAAFTCVGLFVSLKFISVSTTERFSLLSSDIFGEYQRARGELFQYGWGEAIAALPFGYGVGGFPLFHVGGGLPPLRYPHNILLEVAGDYGIVGLTVLGYFLYRSFKVPCRDVVVEKYLFLAYYALAIALTSGDIVHNRYFFLFSTLLIVTKQRRNQMSSQSNEGKVFDLVDR